MSNPIEVISAMTPIDWGYVVVFSALIFMFLGPRLFQDIKGWLA
jgi:hypothetical protein